MKKEYIYIYQTLIYSFLYERTNKDKKINYITFLNPRASNIIKISLDKIVDNWSLLKKELEEELEKTK